MEELDKVKPSDFSIVLLGKERKIKFKNWALAQIEERYGSVQSFKQVQDDLKKKPMRTVPWLLSICLVDKSDLTDDYESILKAMDESDLTINEVADVVLQAINSTLSNIGDGKKKAITAQ